MQYAGVCLVAATPFRLIPKPSAMAVSADGMVTTQPAFTLASQALLTTDSYFLTAIVVDDCLPQS